MSAVPQTGRRIILASWLGTAIFVVSAAVATASESYGSIHRTVCLVLFGLGCVAFLAAFMAGIERSRQSEVAVSNLFFLAGSAPKLVRAHLFGSMLLETVVAFLTASLRPYTLVAFGILVPMYGLGMTGLWGAEHGVFPDRIDTTPAAKQTTTETSTETNEAPGEKRS